MYTAPPSVTLELDKERKWQFDMNAMIALGKALGPKAFERLAALKPSDEEEKAKTIGLDAERFEVYRALIWCGLVSEDPKLTIEAVGALATPRTAFELIVPALDAMNRAFEDPTPAALPATA